jgi:hypothetical protein
MICSPPTPRRCRAPRVPVQLSFLLYDMSKKYKFNDQQGVYFMSFATQL